MEPQIPSRWHLLETAYHFAAISELAIPGSFESTYSKHRLANGLPDVRCVTPPLEVLQKFVDLRPSIPTPPHWHLMDTAYHFAAISELTIPGSFRSTYSKYRLANGLPDVKCVTPPLEVLQKFRDLKQSTPTPPLSPTPTTRPTSPTPPPSHQLPSPISLQPTLEPDETTCTNEVEPDPKTSN